ncbi:hypothetical protein ASE90_16625 [Sphingomonas sp. Leaf67]|nr:hypothetical protein ASE90_16625 [Sphingomonas sp. Leaf67]
MQPHGFRIDTRSIALMGSARLGGGDAFWRPALAELWFELCQDAQHIQERLNGGKAGINWLLFRFPSHPLPLRS